MADVRSFFTDHLTAKLAGNPGLVTSINNIYQFNLGEEGNWTVDLTQEGGSVTEGTADNAGCVVTCSGTDFAKLLDNPGQAMFLFASGKLKVSNITLGMALQKLLA